MAEEEAKPDGEGMASIDERLVQAREAAGFGSARAAAIAKGWPESSYRSHENGTRTVGRDDAMRYAKAFRVRDEWLWAGRGPMLGDEPSQPETSTSQANAVLSKQELPPSTRRLPVYGSAAAGLEGALALDGVVHEWIACPMSLENVPDAYAAYVTGDSMEPRYFAGEKVEVHPAKPARKGDFVVAQIMEHGEVVGFVKRFIGYENGELVLEQYNPPKQLRFARSKVKAVHLVVGSQST